MLKPSGELMSFVLDEHAEERTLALHEFQRRRIVAGALEAVRRTSQLIGQNIGNSYGVGELYLYGQ
jgi:hypothetical protein